MTSRKPALLLLTVAALAGAGCDALGSKPGHDFTVTVVGPSPIDAVARIIIPVRFSVAGCASFEATIQSGSGTPHAVPLVPQADGSTLAEVPAEWVRQDSCFSPTMSGTPVAIDARLVVTCRDVGRTATAQVAIAYAPATWVYVGSGLAFPQTPVQLLFPSPVSGRPYALGPSLIEPWAKLDPLNVNLPFWIDGEAILANPLVRPQLAATSSTVFVSTGCDPSATCPPVAVSASTALRSEVLRGVDQDASLVGGLIWDPLWVPAHVVDMAALADGTIVVLSQAIDAAGTGGGSAITAVTPVKGSPTATVTVIGYFPEEQVQTRFSRTSTGRLAFVSYVLPSGDGRLRSVRHETDGLSVSSSADPTGAYYIGEVSKGSIVGLQGVQLSPDASWTLVPQGPYIVEVATSWAARAGGLAQLWTQGRGGVAWPTGSIALWGAMNQWSDYWSLLDWGFVSVYSASPNGDPLYNHDVHPLGGGATPTILHGVVAVGDKLVLTTSTGIRVLGPDGAVIGGSDPLPCGWVPTSVAVQSGPTTVAVAAGLLIYEFDLTGMTNRAGRAAYRAPARAVAASRSGSASAVSASSPDMRPAVARSQAAASP